jgi:hypothetical protein
MTKNFQALQDLCEQAGAFSWSVRYIFEGKTWHIFVVFLALRIMLDHSLTLQKAANKIYQNVKNMAYLRGKYFL